MKTLLFAVAVASGCVQAGERPPYLMAEEAYFVCPSSRTLQGGIFGKGPLRKFGKQPGDCRSGEWKRVSRQTFKATASEWYGVNWERDIPFFSELRPGEQRP